MRPAQRVGARALALFLLLVQQANCFQSGKIYRYQFEGAITSKVADDDKPQYAGVSIRSPVSVRKSAQDELSVRLEKPEMATFNELVDDIHLLNQRLSFKPMEQATALDKTFRIYLDENWSGVRAFDTHKDEPKWVTNFKRGFLSFFQLKLQETGDSYYTTAEKSVFGECDTDYVVLTSTEPAYLNVTKSRNMAKCKTRFLHRFMPIDSSECIENDRDMQQYKHSNAIYNYQLVGSAKDYFIQRVLLDEQSTFSPFGQKGHTHLVHTKFMLILQGQPEDAGGSTLAVDDSSAQRTESLSYDPPEMLNFYANVNLEQEHHLSNIYQASGSVDQVLNALDALVQEQRAYAGAFDSQASSNYQENSRLAELFMRLNELVGTLNWQKIEQLYSQVEERGEAHKKIFWDFMSVVGTNPSFMFMKKLITEGDAPSVKIKDFLTRLSFHIKMPSKSLFDEYVNLCKSDKIQTNQQYKRLCSLPLASLIHQHCAKPHAKYLRMQQEGSNSTAYKKAQNTCQIATAEEYFTRLVSPIGSVSSSSSSGSGSTSSSAAGPSGGAGSSDDSAMSIGDKMFNIKMAGELGVKPSIDFLIDVVRRRDEHPSLRAAAMWSLNKVSKIYPNQVKRLVVPFFYDHLELTELRIASLYNWLYAGMSLHEMETMAKQLMNEPSRQLALYVYSMFKSMSELHPFPCTAHVEKNAKLVLPTIRRAIRSHGYASMSDSQMSMSNMWHPEYSYGTASIMSAIFSNESMAPSNMFYSSSEIMSGLKLNSMTVSIQAHGLDKLIKRVAGIQGLLADKESFMDIFSLKRRSKRQVNADLIKQELAEIDRELKLGTREFSDVYIAVTISAYGRPITFIDKDSRELKKMLSEDGTIKVPQIKKLLHSFNNHTTQQMMITFEKLEVFNNELGLPLFQSINDFDYKTFKLNSIKLDVEPGFFKDERQGKPPTKISAALDAKLGRHNEMLGSTGTLLVNTKQQVGVGFHKKKLINVPLKMSFEANLAENKLTIKRQPIHDKLLYIKQQPVTFIKSYEPANNNDVKASAEQLLEMRPLYATNNSAQMTPFKLEYMTPLAIGFRLEGKHRAGQDYSMLSWRRYLMSAGTQAIKFMYFYSPGGQPLEVSLSTVTTEENPTKEMVTTFSWKHFRHDASSELSEVDKQLESYTGSTKEQAGGAPVTVQYKASMSAGSSKERKVNLDIDYSRSFDRLLHKWRAFYRFTPLNSADSSSEMINFCWWGQMQFPKYQVDRLLKFDLLDQDHSVNVTSEITFGDECTDTIGSSNDQPKVSMQVKLDWSQEQRAMIEQALKGTSQDADYGRRNSFIPMYKKCMKNRQAGGALLDTTCLYLLYKMSELNHISAVIDHKDVPERWTQRAKNIGLLYSCARVGYMEEMADKPAIKREYKTADGKQDRVYVDANITSTSNPMDRNLSYAIDSSNYHVFYKSVPLALHSISTFPLLDSSYYQMIQRRANNRVCSVSGQQVITFDNLTYTMPQVGDGCFKLISKDCSPESNYVILGAKAGESGKVIKVYVAQKFKVEFVPDKDGKRLSDIKVNGETVSIEPNKSPLRRETKLGARQVEAFSIENNGAYYTLNSKLYKFSVSTDGTWIFVQQSKYYTGKSCGLCGDANGDRLMEFKSPTSSRKVCKDSDDFVWSYVLPSTCASRPANIECVATAA